MAETAPVGLGRTGAGLGTVPSARPADLQDVAQLTGLFCAFALSMQSGDMLKASNCLAVFQVLWNASGYASVDAIMTLRGVAPAAISALPRTLPVPGSGIALGGLDRGTKGAIISVLAFGGVSASALSAFISLPTANIPLWYAINVAPAFAPTDAVFCVWRAIQGTPGMTAQAVLNAAGNCASAAAGGPPAPVPPDTNPGTSPPVPTPDHLPTTPIITLPTLTITGSSSKVPTWVWVAAGGVALGAVVGVGYYVTKNRPDLFRSRKKRRR